MVCLEVFRREEKVRKRARKEKCKGGSAQWSGHAWPQGTQDHTGLPILKESLKKGKGVIKTKQKKEKRVFRGYRKEI